MKKQIGQCNCYECNTCRAKKASAVKRRGIVAIILYIVVVSLSIFSFTLVNK